MLLRKVKEQLYFLTKWLLPLVFQGKANYPSLEEPGLSNQLYGYYQSD